VVCGGFEGLQRWGWLDLEAFGVVFVPMMGVGPPFERRWVLGPCMVVGLGFLLWVVFRVDLLKVMVGLWLHLSIVFLVGFLMEKMSIVPDLPQFHLSIAGKIDLSTGEILPMSLRRI
jgi:hypothetical protein